MNAEERELIRSCTSKIVASPLFANADRLRRFLLFCVEHVLEERTDRLKETLIGMEVFDRGSAFDPRQDSIVRVDARRLRLKLEEYYRNLVVLTKRKMFHREVPVPARNPVAYQLYLEGTLSLETAHSGFAAPGYRVFRACKLRRSGLRFSPTRHSPAAS